MVEPLLAAAVAAGALALGSSIPVAAQTADDTAAPTAPAPPPAPPAGVAPAAAPAEPRIRFEVRFPAERGGGTATGTAGEVEYEDDGRVTAAGGVEVKYQDTTIRAERISVDPATQALVAEGGVTVDQGPRRLAATRAAYDLGARTGTFEDATAFVAPDYRFRGREIAKLGEQTYRIVDGVFTSCEGEVPPWSFAVSRATVTVDGYARIRHARFRAKRTPLLYFPYILWPAKTDRASGFLVPNIGYSKNKGAYLGLAYFQTLGASYDATLFLDAYEKEYYGLGAEARYQPSENTSGTVRGYLVDDPFSDEQRWKTSFEHESRKLPGGLRGVISYQDYSDFEFFRDFERAVIDSSRRTLYSSAFLAGAWGAHSLNILADDRETFIDVDRTIRMRQLPEVEYRLRNTRLGRSPFYLQMLGSASLLEADRGASTDGRWQRADLFPQLSLPLRPAPWISVSLSGGGRATWWGDSTCRPSRGPSDTGPEVCGAGGLAFTGEAIDRALPVAGAQIVGPSLARVYSGRGNFEKLKHVIEPRVTYSYLGDFDQDERSRVPIFDEVDSVDTTNTVRVALINRVLAKPRPKALEAPKPAQAAKETDATATASATAAARPPVAGPTREIFTFELSQRYSFDTEQPLQRSRDGETSERGPLQAELRFNPSPRTNLRLEADYSAFFGELLSRSVSGTVAVGRQTVGATWFTRFDGESGETLGDQLGLTAGLTLFERRLRLDGQVSFNLEAQEGQPKRQQQRLLLEWQGSCYTIHGEWREFQAIDRDDTEYRISLSLKNVGTFLDFNGGERRGSGSR